MTTLLLEELPKMFPILIRPESFWILTLLPPSLTQFSLWWTTNSVPSELLQETAYLLLSAQTVICVSGARSGFVVLFGLQRKSIK
jgi:hypothetical protein